MDVITGPLDALRRVDVRVRTGMPGPPGPPGADSTVPGPPGPPGDAAQATTIVGAFGVSRTPDELPLDGIIPEDWDIEGQPAYQVAPGEALLFVVDAHIYVYTPLAWLDVGQISGPKGDKGDQGDQGERGDMGPRGDQGERGDPGQPGERGPQGDQGPRGDTGDRGQQGERGDKGDQGDQGIQGPQGEPGDIGPEGPPSFPDAPITIGTYGRQNGAWVQVLPISGGTIQGDLSVTGYFLVIGDVRIVGGLTLGQEPIEREDVATRGYVDDTVDAARPDLAPFARLDGATMTGPLVLARDPQDDLDAASKGYVDGSIPDVDLSPYLRTDIGGQMEGILISARGTGPTNPGIGIGDNATGLFRSGTAMIISVAGETVAQFLTAPRELMLVNRLNMANQSIVNVADATLATDALNRRSGDVRYLQPADADARYLQLSGGTLGPTLLNFDPLIPENATHKRYVDQRRAPSQLVNIGGDVPITGGQWGTVHNLPFPIPRGGNSRVRVDLSVNIAGLGGGALFLIGARIGGEPERRIFGYSVATGFVAGFTTTMFTDVSGAAPMILVQVTSIDTGLQSPPNFVVIGGDASQPLRSQVVITDLGPI